MKIVSTKSFVKDISSIANPKDRTILLSVIEDIESCEDITQIPHLKKMQGFDYYYRIRKGHWRIGLKHIEGDKIVLMRCLHRKDIYRKFP